MINENILTPKKKGHCPRSQPSYKFTFTRESLDCPYFYISFLHRKNWVQNLDPKQALATPAPQVRATSLFSTFSPVFCPLWSLRKSWLRDRADSRGPRADSWGPRSHPGALPPFLPFLCGSRAGYRQEDTCPATSLQASQCDDLPVGQCGSWSSVGVRDKCTNGRKVHTAENQHTAFLFYQPYKCTRR